MGVGATWGRAVSYPGAPTPLLVPHLGQCSSLSLVLLHSVSQLLLEEGF